MSDTKKSTKKDMSNKQFLLFLVGGAVVLYFMFFTDIGTTDYTSDASETDKPEQEKQEQQEPEVTVEEKKDLLQKELDRIINEAEGDIQDITFQPNHTKDGSFMHVVVSDTWYNSSEKAKKRFADKFGEKVRLAVFNSGLQEEADKVIVDFVDSYGAELASYSVFSGKYDIKE